MIMHYAMEANFLEADHDLIRLGLVVLRKALPLTGLYPVIAMGLLKVANLPLCQPGEPYLKAET